MSDEFDDNELYDEEILGLIPISSENEKPLNEKYYICPDCGELETETGILNSCSSGGMGMCYCRFCINQWSEEYGKFEPVFLREFIQYVEIPQKIYEELKGEENTVLRLEMYRNWLEFQKPKTCIHCGKSID